MLALSLPPARIAVPLNAPVGATLGTLHVAAVSDIPLKCSGESNAREVRLTRDPVPVPDFKDVYRTNVAGIGMRVSASGGSFAGIDDGARPAPYKVALPPKAERLTGFGAEIVFIKIGATHDGVLAEGRLLTVLAGGADLVDVDVPANAVVFASSQCEAVRANGMVAAGVGTGGAFTQESVLVSAGCNPELSVMVQVTQPYVYRGESLVLAPGPDASRTAGVARTRAARAAGSLADGVSAGLTGGAALSGAGGPGTAGRAGDFRR
ncbi:hypothetical protein FAZ69_31425 [Trinickia terrae]|uniref:MrkD-like receptor binding domain-containing protein n=1 Tax=Trinickia terrae TaxID=2571161 RepID=A0A4U1HDI4_9BURK|nr:hypothetical protein [Trinickia terrae]TKC78952.1 hypothetical protein FAZ69_31425 [Trinickia terrae]